MTDAHNNLGIVVDKDRAARANAATYLSCRGENALNVRSEPCTPGATFVCSMYWAWIGIPPTTKAPKC